MKNVAVYRTDPISGEQTLLNLFEQEAYIGTSMNATVHINDFRAIGFHAYIRDINVDESEANDFMILDLGNGSNTFVNGKRVKQSPIKSGDVIILGNTHLTIKRIPKVMMEFQQFLPDQVIASSPSTNRNYKVDEFSLATEKNILEACLYWGQQRLESRTFQRGAQVTIGSDIKSTFAVTLPDRKNHKIATYKGDKLKLKIPYYAKGLFWQGDEAYTLDYLKDERKDDDISDIEHTLRVGDKAEIQLGEQILSFKFVLPPEKLARYRRITFDMNLLKLYAAVVAVFILFFSLMLLEPPQKEVISKIPPKLKKILYEAGIKSATKKQKSAIGEMLAQGGRARGDSGMAKTKRSESEKKAKVKKKASPTKVAKTEKSAQVKKSNIAATTKQSRPDLSKVFASTSTDALEDISLKGATEKGNTVSSISGGHFARGSSGLGSGGGGVSVGIGQLKGASSGGGMGAGDEGLAPTKGKSIEIKIDEEIVYQDSLDPEVIAAIIKRYMPQIEHCYEARLSQDSGLKGKVTVYFQIISTGGVASPKILATTLKDQITERCIINKIRKWKFPKPRGGGVVDVNYPFLLMSTRDK
ncbi:MAG: AgmX/PglI C-terminal domain-containing protein [Bacteriovoracaceae bacterium]|nr:AgmX/PglI C-terminal domain-containing protein [Bacteriovoracaceae bacterium]